MAALTGDIWQVVPDVVPDPARMVRLAAFAWTLPGASAGGFGQLAARCNETGSCYTFLACAIRQLVLQTGI